MSFGSELVKAKQENILVFFDSQKQEGKIFGFLQLIALLSHQLTGTAVKPANHAAFHSPFEHDPQKDNRGILKNSPPAFGYQSRAKYIFPQTCFAYSVSDSKFTE